MKYFNIDMHISIIHDVKTLLPEIGHTVDSCCMSGHTWVNNETQCTIDILKNNWFNIDQQLCDNFYQKYKDELSHYDGFIHSYPPAFALLFEKFNKPIYTIACTRYEFPCGSGDTASVSRLQWLNEKLLDGYKNNQIKFITNNLYDKKYCETFIGGEWTFIPSICKYVSHMTCDGGNDTLILWDRNRDGLRNTFNHPKINKKFTISQVYDRNALVKQKGIIHIPYNISIMSAFEHFAMGIPMFVPSYDLLIKWKNENRDVLNELQFNNNLNKNIKDEWIKLADWYDETNMPGVQMFESLEHLNWLIDNSDYRTITKTMKDRYFLKEKEIKNKWKEILK
jgi:hypothetical protein